MLGHICLLLAFRANARPRPCLVHASSLRVAQFSRLHHRYRVHNLRLGGGVEALANYVPLPHRLLNHDRRAFIHLPKGYAIWYSRVHPRNRIVANAG